MTSSKVHKNDITHWKIDIIEPRACSTLAPIYDSTLLFDNFPLVEEEFAPKENILPLFSQKLLQISETFSPS